MSYTARVLDAALKAMGGVYGEMILSLIAQRGLNKNKVRSWQAKLRTAADCLEDLIK